MASIAAGRDAPEDRPVSRPCPRCGRAFERVRDPGGLWSVCVRCGSLLWSDAERLTGRPRSLDNLRRAQ